VISAEGSNKETVTRYSLCGRKLVKGNVYAVTDHKDPEEGRGITTLSLTSALDGGGWSTQLPGRCTPGKEKQYPL
jgi:hypothetical protein